MCRCHIFTYIICMHIFYSLIFPLIRYNLVDFIAHCIVVIVAHVLST